MWSQLLTEEKTTNILRPNDGPVARLAADGWETAFSLAPSQGYPAAIELFQQGSPAQEVYFVDRGLVKLIHLEQDGRELIVDLRSPGWLLGAASVIAQKPHAVTAVTLTKCHLRHLPAQLFLSLLKADAQLSWQLHQMHSREVCDQVTRVVQLGCLSARHRLENLLWQLISALELSGLQREVRLQLPLKHQEIAELIVVTPAYLSRLFSQLEAENILQRKKGWLVISDPQALWHGDKF